MVSVAINKQTSGEGLSINVEESRLVERAKTGDAAAFEAIYQQYEKRIYAYTYRLMGNPDDAYDLTQDCFVKAYLALAKTPPDLNLSAWLHRIASNGCLDVLRRRKLIRWLPWDGFMTEQNERVDPTENPERAYIQEETRFLVQKVLNKMSPKHRMCLILKEYQEMSCEEIASVMGVSRAAVKSLLFRGREEFRKIHATLGEER